MPLILKRKPDQGIVFIDEATGEQIVITVAHIHGKEVSLRIECDNAWKIWRQELLTRSIDDESKKH